MEFKEAFYKDPYSTEHDAKAISCIPGKKGYEVILNDTIFYPEGGGQPSDRGFLILPGGERLEVIDVKRSGEDTVSLLLPAPVPEGAEVYEEIDWDFRFSLMQNHSGEHIVSGLIHSEFGYENVGFHMSDVITIDISGELNWEQAMDIERKANAVVWKNCLVNIMFPSEEDLNSLEYRSKKELSGKVRLINIEGADSCACCGLHVKHTGEIGLIKILSLIRYKGGVRLEMVCGKKALYDYENKQDSVTEIKNLLSVKPDEVTDAVRHVIKESAEKSARIAGLNSRYFDMRVQELKSENDIIFTVENELDGIEIRKLCDRLNKSGKAGTSVVLAPAPSVKKDGGETGGETGYLYVIASTRIDLKAAAKTLNEQLNGRGGGSKEMIQGTFFSDLGKIREAVQSLSAIISAT